MVDAGLIGCNIRSRSIGSTRNSVVSIVEIHGEIRVEDDDANEVHSEDELVATVAKNNTTEHDSIHHECSKEENVVSSIERSLDIVSDVQVSE